MKGILLLGLFITSTIVVAQQKKETITFTKYLKVDEADYNRGVTVVQTADGGYILTGLTNGNRTNAEDAFLIKTDEKGNEIWSKTYGGSGTDNGWAVRQTNDGGYVFVGFTDSFGEGGMDVYLTKVDAEGNEEWSNTFGGKGEEFGWDLRNTSDGGFIIASQTNSFGNGEIDAYLIKVDKDGKQQWSKTYGGPKIDRVFSVQQTKDGGFIAAGITYSYESINDEDRDGYLLKTDPKGNLEWYKILGGNDYDVAHAVSLTDDGGSIVIGYGESYAKAERTDVYLIKANSKGKVAWTQTFGSVAGERGIKGVQTKDGGYVATGFIDKDLDLFLVRASRNGDELWTRSIGGDREYSEFGYTVKETFDGGFILCGHKENMATKESEILLIKTDSEGKQ